MKIAFKHLIKNIDHEPEILEVSDKLFQLGHEHQIENDIFDIEFTPNRGDCLSINGLQRDLSNFYDFKRFEIYSKELDKLKIDFVNDDCDACPKISFMKIEVSGNIATYKDELKSYFEDLKISKNNFFTDVSNYISYETGQPTHCYDASKMDGKLIFCEVNDDVEFNCLLDKKVNLSGKNHVFKLDDEIINLAGVVGGDTTKCTNDTKSVIVECAFFKPESVIGKSIKYDINSEASYKFERGVDRENQENVLRRFLKVVEDHLEISSVEFFTKEYLKYDEKKIPNDIQTINNILGTKIKNSTYEKFLSNLELKVNTEEISIPSFRSDIVSQNDLAEEVARLIGYDNIESKRFKIITKKNIEKNIENNIKSLLIDNGFYEVINAPFVDDHNHASIKVDNPLDSNKPYLRTNLKNSLIANLLYNERRQKDSIKLFEISEIYNLESLSNLIHQKRTVLGMIASGRVGKNFEDFSQKISHKFCRGVFDEYVNESKIIIEEIPRDTLNSKLKDKIYYFEINIEDFLPNIAEYISKVKPLDSYIKYNPISEYPSSTRDISFSIKDAINLKTVQDIIFSYNNEILKEVFVFDFYENTKMKEIKIGFRFVFQSSINTITDKEVDSVLEDIILKTTELKNVEIPGLTDGN